MERCHVRLFHYKPPILPPPLNPAHAAVAWCPAATKTAGHRPAAPCSLPAPLVRLDRLHPARQQLLGQRQGPLGQQRHRHLAIGAVDLEIVVAAGLGASSLLTFALAYGAGGLGLGSV